MDCLPHVVVWLPASLGRARPLAAMQVLGKKKSSFHPDAEEPAERRGFFHHLGVEYMRFDERRKRWAEKRSRKLRAIKHAQLSKLKSLEVSLIRRFESPRRSSIAGRRQQSSHGWAWGCTPRSGSVGEVSEPESEPAPLVPHDSHRLFFDALEDPVEGGALPSALRAAEDEGAMVRDEDTRAIVERKRAQAHGARLTSDYDIDRLTPEDRWFTPEGGWPQQHRGVGKRRWAPKALMETAEGAPNLFAGYDVDRIGTLRLEVLSAEGARARAASRWGTIRALAASCSRLPRQAARAGVARGRWHAVTIPVDDSRSARRADQRRRLHRVRPVRARAVRERGGADADDRQLARAPVGLSAACARLPLPRAPPLLARLRLDRR